MVRAAKRETPSANLSLYGGLIAIGLAIVGFIAVLTIFPVGPPINAFTNGMQSEFNRRNESIATQVANVEVDTHAQFNQSQARLDRIVTRIDALEGRLAAVESRRTWNGSKLDALDSKIGGLRDVASALAGRLR